MSVIDITRSLYIVVRSTFLEYNNIPNKYHGGERNCYPDFRELHHLQVSSVRPVMSNTLKFSSTGINADTEHPPIDRTVRNYTDALSEAEGYPTP